MNILYNKKEIFQMRGLGKGVRHGGRARRCVMGMGRRGVDARRMGWDLAVMPRDDRDCLIGGGVKGLRSEVKSGSCVISAGSEVWSQKSEEESGRRFDSPQLPDWLSP